MNVIELMGFHGTDIILVQRAYKIRDLPYPKETSIG